MTNMHSPSHKLTFHETESGSKKNTQKQINTGSLSKSSWTLIEICPSVGSISRYSAALPLRLYVIGPPSGSMALTVAMTEPEHRANVLVTHAVIIIFHQSHVYNYKYIK